MTTRQDEAAHLFTEVIRDLTTTQPELQLVMRRCQHACELLNWTKQRDWFRREISGYPTNEPVPPHRAVHGRAVWRPGGTPHQRVEFGIESSLAGNDFLQPEDAYLEVRAGIDWLLIASEAGYEETTSETKEEWSSYRRESVHLERVRTFSAAAFRTVLSTLETLTFDFASQSYTFLRYGAAISSIFSSYQTHVDAVLHEIGLSNHLDAIQSGLQSANPEEWRQAVFGCRDMVSDVANYLWQDPRPTYAWLPGKGENGKLQVTRKNTANRLRAYLHQKGFPRTRGAFEGRAP